MCENGGNSVDCCWKAACLLGGWCYNLGCWGVKRPSFSVQAIKTFFIDHQLMHVKSQLLNWFICDKMCLLSVFELTAPVVIEMWRSVFKSNWLSDFSVPGIQLLQKKKSSTDVLWSVNPTHTVNSEWLLLFVDGEQQKFMIHPPLIHDLNHCESRISSSSLKYMIFYHYHKVLP